MATCARGVPLQLSAITVRGNVDVSSVAFCSVQFLDRGELVARHARFLLVLLPTSSPLAVSPRFTYSSRFPVYPDPTLVLFLNEDLNLVRCFPFLALFSFFLSSLCLSPRLSLFRELGKKPGTRKVSVVIVRVSLSNDRFA